MTNTTAKNKALSSVYSDFREDGAKLQKTFLLPVSAIKCDWKENIRPLNKEHVDNWMVTLEEGDYVPAILVEMRGDTPYVIEGFHRHTAVTKYAKAHKDEEVFIECKEWRGDEPTKLITMRNSTSGLPLTFLEDAEVITRIKAEGDFTPEALGKRLGISRTAVNNKILIAEAEEGIKELIREDTISATMAIEFITKHGVNALAQIQHALERANNAGKTKVTKGSGGKPAFSVAKFRAALELLSIGLDYEEYANTKHQLGDGDVDITLTLDKSDLDELVDIIEDYVEYKE